MADAALFVGFGQPARAREQQALDLFNRALALYTELQARGEIESFEPVLLEPQWPGRQRTATQFHHAEGSASDRAGGRGRTTGAHLRPTRKRFAAPLAALPPKRHVSHR